MPSDECYRTLLVKVQIGSGNGFVSDGITSLSEPVFTQIYGAIWRDSATMC